MVYKWYFSNRAVWCVLCPAVAFWRLWDNLICIDSSHFIYFALQNTRIIPRFVGLAMGSDLGYRRKCCKRLRCPSWLTQQTPRCSQPQPVLGSTAIKAIRHSSIPPEIILIFMLSTTPGFFWVPHPGMEQGVFLALGFLQGVFWQSSEFLSSSGSSASRGGEAETRSWDCIQYPPSSVGISSKKKKKRKNFPPERYFHIFQLLSTTPPFLALCCKAFITFSEQLKIKTCKRPQESWWRWRKTPPGAEQKGPEQLWAATCQPSCPY